ncbi:multidrug resistance-associated protein 5, partial [Tanacetum coccineum]
VDEGKRTCSCMVWQLSGLPCVHATKVIFLINRVPESYVLAWFETDMCFVAYYNYVKPVPGMNFWPNQSMYSTVLPPKPRKMPGRPRKKRIRAISSRGRGGVAWSRCGASGLIGREAGGSGGASGLIGRGAGRSGGASGSRGRGTAGLRGSASGSIGRGAGGSKSKPVSTTRTQKRQGKKKVGTSSFAKWFGLQDEPEQTQTEPQQTQHEPEQTQVKDQVEQIEDQVEIDLTQLEQTQEPTQDQVHPQEQPLEQTQEPTQDQVHPQEQPQQAALRMPSARILQRKLGK